MIAARVADVGGVPMSALVAEAPEPRAVVVALHGGAASSRYFDWSAPGMSLLRTGPAVGFTVVALDRPGYGASAPHADSMETAQDLVDLAYGGIDALLDGTPRGAGVFLMAHSMGCVLAVQMAADERGTGLLGLEIAGIGLRPQPQGAVIIGAAVEKAAERQPPPTGIGLRQILWGPAHVYPPDVSASAREISSASPAHEGRQVRRWLAGFPELAARVKIPVHYTLGDQETVWSRGREALDEVAAQFTASPRVVAEEQAGAAHNISRGLSARAYHLRVLAFADDCASALVSTGPPL